MNLPSANQNFITPENVRILKNAAGAGVKLVDTFLTNLTPHIDTAIKDFFSETSSTTNGGGYSGSDMNVSSKRIIKYYKKETTNNVFIACEIVIDDIIVV